MPRTMEHSTTWPGSGMHRRRTSACLHLAPICTQTSSALSEIGEGGLKSPPMTSPMHRRSPLMKRLTSMSAPALLSTEALDATPQSPSLPSQFTPGMLSGREEKVVDVPELQIEKFASTGSSFSVFDSPRSPTSPTSPKSLDSGRRFDRAMSMPVSPLQITRHRPWRKPKAEVAAERAEADAILGIESDAAEGSGVDIRALLFCLLAQESLNEMLADLGGSKAIENKEQARAVEVAQAAVDKLRQAATNAATAEEVQASRVAAADALHDLGLTELLRARKKQPIVTKYDPCHRVLPGLWLGSWVALNNDCEELRRRKVTHIVSIVSTEQRRLPDFIRGHLHICADDREEAAVELSSHFPEICRFVDAARSQPRGSVYVHCGAGISRAPTATASYVMWKLGVSAAVAVQLIKRVRPNIRPNLGFVRQLRRWEEEMKSLPVSSPDFSASREVVTCKSPKQRVQSPKQRASTSPKHASSRARNKTSFF